jgi:HSP20 family protein
MALRNLAIWDRKHNGLGNSNFPDTFKSFQTEIDHFFDGFFNNFGRPTSSLFNRGRFESFSPKIDISDEGSSVEVAAELPGLEEKDIQVSLNEDLLTIKGEKKYSDEKNDKDFYRVERRFGSFERSIKLPKEIDIEKINASFKNGVLTISLPKTEKAKEGVRQIEVNAV